MKILLANLPWINDKEYIGIRAGSRWPHLRMKKESLPYFPFPFSLAYAAAVLKDAGHQACLKDCIAEEMGEGDFKDIAESFRPQMVIFETSTPSIENDLRYARWAKERLGAKTALCGQHATALAQDLLNEPYVDYVLLGEYEYTARALAGSLDKEENVSGIKGVCSKDNGKMFINERAQLIQDLDGLPYPLRSALPMHKYVDGFCKHVPNSQMVTSRGCPYECIFCLEPQVYYGRPNYRKRSALSVVEEMEYLAANFNAREIYFDDSSFSVDQERVKQICRLIRQRSLKTFWSCMADADLSEETLLEMKNANCIGIKFGVESAEPQILKNINKHINLDQVKKVTAACRKIGIETHATYAFGLPGENKATLKRTIDFAFSLGTDTAQFSIAVPYPGTLFYRMAREKGWLVTDRWADFNAATSTVVEYPDLKRQDLMAALRHCRSRIILKTIRNPRLLVRYLVWIKRYSGLSGLFGSLAEKLAYLIRSIF